MNSILDKIVAQKKSTIDRLSHTYCAAKWQLDDKNGVLPAVRDFIGRIQAFVDVKKPAVIAEVKKASPSKGVICQDFNPVTIAQAYEKAGACCLSVLTDEPFFQGHTSYLNRVKEAVQLPLLRKDFIIDPCQVYESRYLGADCILLIAAILDDKMLQTLFELAKAIGLSVLIEVHTLAELKRVLPLKPELIGINNRDLHSFNTCLKTTLTLAQHITAPTIVISESGIHTRDDITMLKNAGIYSFLIGEGLMKNADPGEALFDLLAL